MNIAKESEHTVKKNLFRVTRIEGHNDHWGDYIWIINYNKEQIESAFHIDTEGDTIGNFGISNNSDINYEIEVNDWIPKIDSDSISRLDQFLKNKYGAGNYSLKDSIPLVGRVLYSQKVDLYEDGRIKRQSVVHYTPREDVGTGEDFDNSYLKTYRTINTYEYNENYPKGQVYDQSPKANDQVKGGKTRTVTLKVSLGEETNKMPDFVNQTETSALAQLNAMNLGLKITTKEESSDTIVAGYVIRTEPEAKTELTKEQAVTIYISLGSTKMPELKLQTKANAEALLKAMGLNLKTTFLEEESDDVAEGSVTRTEPASGSELSKGQVVTVYISKGNGKLKVPPVEGLDVMDAIKLLREAGLTYDIKRVFSETEEKDRVIRQSEKANTQVAKDTVVTLEVSDGPAPTNPPTEPTQPTTEPTQPTPPEEPVG